MTKVELRITGGLLRFQLIGTATKSPVGWLFYWNTTTVPNGVYRLQSVAYSTRGATARGVGPRRSPSTTDDRASSVEI